MKTSENLWLKKKKRFNQMKALAILLTSMAGLTLGLWWQTGLFLLLAWVSHEVLWSDHIFYDPKSDYNYSLNSDIQQLVNAEHGIQRQGDTDANSEHDTWFLSQTVQSSGVSGRVFDPFISLSCGNKTRKQYFERGVNGLRYINLSDFADELNAGQLIQVAGKYCSLEGQGTLHGFSNPDFRKQRILIIAPHADDAELAAFGLYSQSNDVHIVTLTAGEVEMEDYYHVHSKPEEASVLKGQLRSMDSIAIPLWGGVPQQRCIQLGYFCKRLKNMSEQPEEAFASLTADVSDTRLFRTFNSGKLSSDEDGRPTWNNLIQDLVELLDRIQPEVIITPNPDIDPHEDHIYGTKAIREAIKKSSANPMHELLYTNHYRTTDMFAFGPPHSTASLPPDFSGSKVRIYSCQSDLNLQKRKVFSLRMMHDLKDKWVLKKQVRRFLSERLINRRNWRYGSEPYLHKAVKSNEVFLYKEPDETL